MSTTDLFATDQLRGLFRRLNRFMLALWRLGLGRFVNAWPAVFGRIMILTHTGRKTGLKRRTPVNYAIVDGEIFCIAAFGRQADWHRNIKADPRVEVWLPDGWWVGEASDVSDSEDFLSIMRQVLLASGFAAYAFGINVRKLSDQALSQIVRPYRLIRIRPLMPRTGPGGPGELAWIWPLATMILLPLLLRRRRRH